MNPTTAGSQLISDRQDEFDRLHLTGDVYLDYTGAGLYPNSLVRAHANALCARLLGNPHSTNPAATAATVDVIASKRAVLEFFQASPDEYDVVLTPNATGAIRLVGEAGQWQRLVVTADNHNSVIGLRELVRRDGGTVEYLALDSELRIPAFGLASCTRPALFAYPAQSNFSGVRHPLSWIAQAHDAGYRVLLDAASYVPTSSLSLTDHKPDFVTISFYKMFGYPTGIGALIARRDALAQLRRPWFSGGTVEFASVLGDTHMMREGSQSFEDGTVNFLAASAIEPGLRFLKHLGMQRVQQHVARLTAILVDRIQRLTHSNGQPVIDLYGPRDCNERGGTVSFNVLSANGKLVSYETVVARAAEHAISLRGGCFCNPGASEYAFKYDPDELIAAFQSMGSTFTHDRLREALGGKAVGAVRASLGYGSAETDVDALIELLKTFLDHKEGVPC